MTLQQVARQVLGRPSPANRGVQGAKPRPEEAPADFYGIFLPSARVEDRFPVTLAWMNGGSRETVLKASARHYDGKELCVEAASSLPRGKRVSIRFDLPHSLLPGFTGIGCDFPGELVSAREPLKADPRWELVLKWKDPLPNMLLERLYSRYRSLALLLAAASGVMLWIRWTTLAFFWYDPVIYFYSMSVGIFFFTRFYLSHIHQPPAWSSATPTISVVISVRNEEKAIAGAVESCFSADYPPEKREVLVVNDGSTDGTARVLAAIQPRYPDLKVFHIPPSGKRFGMAKGIQEAKGEIIVVVDSDTILDRRALRHIVCGFEDPTLGAVSGFTDVANADKNWLTQMQQVRYRMSYDMMKAPESVFGVVSCCPGCLSAYRRKYLLKILDPWLKQRFLGAPATFGDDRSLTNYIMRDYRIVYNPNAYSWTYVPETLMHYLRQQVRWKKSWLREFLIASTFMWKKHPVAAMGWYVSGLCSLLSPFMGARALWLGFGEGLPILGYLSGLLLLGFTMGLFVLWKRPSRHWYLSWVLVGLQVVLMGPQTYYAMLTMRKNHWGTR